MISHRIARELRELGHDVHAIKRDRTEFENRDDYEILMALADEQRAIVSINADDFERAHQRAAKAGRDHYGILLTTDSEMPRRRETIPQWVEVLDRFLNNNRRDEAMRNRVTWLP